MATTEEIQKLILQVEGQEKLRSLNEQITQADKAMRGLHEQFKQGQITQAQYAQRMTTVATHLSKVRDQAGEVEKSLRGVGSMSPGMQQAGMMNLSYAIQDFTSASGGLAQKFNAITNNLQMLAMSFGVGGAWAIAITGVMTAVQTLIHNWDGIGDLLSGVDSEKAKEVAEKAADIKKKFDALAATPTQEQAKEEDAWKTAITERQAETLRKGLAEMMFNRPEGDRWTDEDKRAMAAAEQRRVVATGFGGAKTFESEEDTRARAEATRNAINDRINKANSEQAQKLITDATGSGPEADLARSKIIQMAEANPGAFPPGFADEMKTKMKDLAFAPQKAIQDNMTAAWKGQKKFDAAEAEKERGADRLLQDQQARQQERMDAETRKMRDIAQADRDRAQKTQLRTAGEDIERAAERTQAFHGDKPQETDALEAASLEAERASIAAVAQADALSGQNTVYVQRFQEIAARLNHLQMRNSRQMSGQMGGGGFSALPMYTGSE